MTYQPTIVTEYDVAMPMGVIQYAGLLLASYRQPMSFIHQTLHDKVSTFRRLGSAAGGLTA
jgi:hypothetical protein